MTIIFVGETEFEHTYPDTAGGITEAYLDMREWVENGGWCLVNRQNSYILVNDAKALVWKP